MDDKIINKAGCNDIVMASFLASQDLKECPTKEEINATKKVIVLDSDVTGNAVYTRLYDNEQLVEIDDVGLYLECNYITDCYGVCVITVSDSSGSEQITAFTTSANGGSGTSILGLTQSFKNREWDDDFIITATYASYAQQFAICGKPGTKNESTFTWNHADSNHILQNILGRKIDVVISNDTISYNLVADVTGPIELKLNETKQITLLYNKYVNGVLDESIDVTESATWKSSSGTIVSVIDGFIIANNSNNFGPATITATYGDISMEWEINIVTYNLEVVLVSDHDFVYVGQSISYNVYFIEYLDGVQRKRTNVSGKATWTSAYDFIAEPALVGGVCMGTYQGKKAGNTYIKVIYTIDGVTYVNSDQTLEVLENYITINPKQSTFESNADSVEVSVDFGGNVYSVSDDSGWITFQKSGNITTVNVTENTSTSSRNGTVTFKCGTATETMTILQHGVPQASDPTISLSASRYDVNSSACYGDITPTLTNATTYEIGELPSWITSNKTSGSNGETVRFYISENMSTSSSRSWDIIFSIPGTDVKKVLTINQKHADAPEPDAPEPDAPEPDVETVIPISLITSTSAIENVGTKTSTVSVTVTYSNGLTSDVTANENLSCSMNKYGICGYNAGAISHYGAGTAILTFTYSENGATVTCELSVTTKPIELIDLELTVDNVMLHSGESIEGVTATCIFNNDRSYVSSTAVWISEDETVATVIKNENTATITAIGAGTTRIVVTVSDNGEKTKYITVTVSEVISDDIIEYEFNVMPPAIVKQNKFIRIPVMLNTIVNGIQTNSEDITELCTWESSNPSMLQISENGIIQTLHTSGSVEVIVEYIRNLFIFKKTFTITIISDNDYKYAYATLEESDILSTVHLWIVLQSGSVLSQLYSWECIGGSNTNIIGKTGNKPLRIINSGDATKTVIMKLTSLSPYYSYLGKIVYPSAEITFTAPESWEPHIDSAV